MDTSCGSNATENIALASSVEQSGPALDIEPTVRTTVDVSETTFDNMDDAYDALDQFRTRQLQRFSLAKWLRRFHWRQVKRLELLVVERRLNTSAVATPRKPRPPSAGACLGDCRRLASRPLSAAAVTAPNLSLSVAANESRHSATSRCAGRGGDAHPARLSATSLPAPVVSPLDAFASNGGWRYGHMRTVAPSHRPKLLPPGSSAMNDGPTVGPAVNMLLEVAEATDAAQDNHQGRAPVNLIAVTVTTASTSRPRSARPTLM
jgi:hypothetical protein